MKHLSKNSPVIFSLNSEVLVASLCKYLNGETGYYNKRDFPDGESYLCIKTDVYQRHCVVVANMSHPNSKFLPLLFLVDTLRELGATSVGLIAPYLSYMRQDRRFLDGEAITTVFICRFWYK